MGHAIHFLSRLERLGLQETELALSLYRDASLLRRVLAMARLPEAHERVAIALRREEGGPHLVVTRAGDFVTCLGEGMSVAELPVVPRSQLDALSRQVETLRERMKIADELVGPGKRTAKLFLRLAQAGHLLSREEYLGISAFSALLTGRFFKWMINSSVRLMTRVPGMVPLANASLRSSRVREKLLILWKWQWEIAHLLALCADHGRRIDEGVSKEGYHLYDTSCLLISSDFRPIGMRAVMLMSGIGKQLLPEYKERLRKPEIEWAQIETVAVLLAMGLRFEALKAEIGKLLAKLPGLVPAQDNALIPGHLPMLRDFLLLLFSEPIGAAFMANAGLGRQVWDEWTRKLDPVSPLRLADPKSEETTAACARARFNSPEGIWGPPILEFLLCSAAAGQVKPESLYWPAKDLAELQKALDDDWAIEQTARYLKRYRPLIVRSDPERVEHKAAPNDRCPCGSGKKFKRCCMGKAA